MKVFKNILFFFALIALLILDIECRGGGGGRGGRGGGRIPTGGGSSGSTAGGFISDNKYWWIFFPALLVFIFTVSIIHYCCNRDKYRRERQIKIAIEQLQRTLIMQGIKADQLKKFRMEHIKSDEPQRTHRPEDNMNVSTISVLDKGQEQTISYPLHNRPEDNMKVSAISVLNREQEQAASYQFHNRPQYHVNMSTKSVLVKGQKQTTSYPLHSRPQYMSVSTVSVLDKGQKQKTSYPQHALRQMPSSLPHTKKLHSQKGAKKNTVFIL